MKQYKVAILGATGAVGREMMKVLAERDFPISELHLLASQRSVGQAVHWKGHDIPVELACDAAFEGMDIVGFKSLFGFHYDAPERGGWFDTVRGVGRTPETKVEGFRRGGLMATALIGPLLILNPPLCKWLLRQMGAPSDALAFEGAAFASYEKRVAEFKESGRSWQYS